MTFILDDSADFVIVGTGAGGATAARVLTEAGYSVILLEEGAYLRNPNRPHDLVDAMEATFRDFGTQATIGTRPLPILQGKVVGGSTAINSGIIWRMPDDVIDDWHKRFGLSELVPRAELGRIFTQIETELDIAKTQDEVLGGNAKKMDEACKKLGLPGKPITRNAKKCKGTAMCQHGCPTEARQSMDVSYIPRSIEYGARLYPLCRAERVVIENGRAEAITGQVLDEHTKRPRGAFRARGTRAVIVAASAIQTPVILRRSGLRGLVGERFQAHPGAAVVGRFTEPVTMGFGATQGYEVPQRERGFKLEALGLPPEMLATRLPGIGPEWQERIAHLGHYAQWAVQVRMKAMGRVRPTWSGGAHVTYTPTREDFETTREGVILISKMMFAIGATEVYPGIAGKPEVLKSIDEVELLRKGDVGPGDMHMVASHLFGTACAGKDPRTSVVAPTLESHEVKDLFVMDASVFPTNLGVNPQHSIMGIVWRASEMLANRARVGTLASDAAAE